MAPIIQSLSGFSASPPLAPGALPKLKELTIRVTGVTDASVDKLLGMKSLQSLTFQDNGSVTADAVLKLATRKWAKLDLGISGGADSPATAAPYASGQRKQTVG